MDDAIRKAFPLVSILIVTHNSAEYVPLCLEALLRNTSYPSYEVVVVDNASRDRTTELLEAFAARERRGYELFETMKTLGSRPQTISRPVWRTVNILFC